MKQSFLFFTFLFPIILSAHTCHFKEQSFDPVNYVNDWRESSGLSRLKPNTYLKKAALNHSRYRRHYHTGHYERRGDRGFTGKEPTDRAIYAGYPLRQVSENIAEAPNAVVGVENLMSAIYHRFGFLSYHIDEMGMAWVKQSSNNIYTYVMGNSILARECRYSTYRNETPFYHKICKNKRQKIGVQRKTKMDHKLLSHTPKFVLYPYANATNVPPAFYEEHPDPLPRHTMVGNPLSIEFHPRYKDKSITIKGVALKDLKTGRSISLMPLYKRNDPNKKLGSTQFAFFPQERLEWNSLYEASLSYKISSERSSKGISWRFKTKQQPSMIVVDNNHHKFLVEKEKTYTLYFKPSIKESQSKKVVHAQFGYRYYKGSMIKYDIVDSMTIKVCLHGKKGSVFRVKNEASLRKREATLILK